MDNGTTTILNARYGIKRQRFSWRLPLVAVVSGLLLLLLIASLAFFPSHHRVKGTTIGYSITDGKHAELTALIVNTSGRPIGCSFQALDDSFAVVGWKEKRYPESYDNYYDTLHIRTERPAVSVSVKECRVLPPDA